MGPVSPGPQQQISSVLRLDKLDRKYLGDAILMLIILVITIGAFVKFQNPSVLFAGSLAITFFVTANILMSS